MGKYFIPGRVWAFFYFFRHHTSYLWLISLRHGKFCKSCTVSHIDETFVGIVWCHIYTILWCLFQQFAQCVEQVILVHYTTKYEREECLYSLHKVWEDNTWVYQTVCLLVGLEPEKFILWDRLVSGRLSTFNRWLQVEKLSIGYHLMRYQAIYATIFLFGTDGAGIVNRMFSTFYRAFFMVNIIGLALKAKMVWFWWEIWNIKQCWYCIPNEFISCFFFHELRIFKVFGAHLIVKTAFV